MALFYHRLPALSRALYAAFSSCSAIILTTLLAVRLAADLEHLDYVAVLLHPSPELELSDGAGARAVGRRAQVQPGGGREATP